ncbi:MAG: UDP-N-acetylmuramoyl-L-alanyl-D-glutamate--2,6-diaminopimelate ligase [Hyphomonadaceae bacterium]|nr:UDP-N-acetylmuramoyl-L-alanyl-D-glutamate--2,6-diaminopimelate ligase [Hyphomonadaceae bacterium]
MTLRELFDAVGAGGDVAIAGLTADSRAVRPGFVFAALQGVVHHGRDFIAAAKAAGAVAVLHAGDADAQGLIEIVAPDARRALALAAARFYPRQPETIVAVTGTNGKSSTVDFLRQIWAAQGVRAASLGTLGAIGPADLADGVIDLGHTTPDPVAIHATLQRLADAGVTHVAMEASSHGLEQRRLDGVRLRAGAFTNLTQDHLDYHGDMDAYRAAKLRLWRLIGGPGPVVINADAVEAEAFEQEALRLGLDVVSCGWRASAYRNGLKIAQIQPRPDSQTLTLMWNGAERDVDLPLIGEFQAINAVTAAALALALGGDFDGALDAMTTLKPVRGRIEHVGATAQGAHVFVDYAHTPDGLDVLLRAARPHAPGRIVLAFGCGGDRDAGKRPKMGAVAHRLADVVIVTDDNPRSEDASVIRKHILAACPGALEIGDRGEAIRAGVAMLRPGDALLIAGKGHETGQIVGARVLPFSDQVAARAALAERAA